MKKKKTKVEYLKSIIIGLTLATLLSFAIFLAFSLFLQVIFYHDQYGQRDYSPIYIVLAFIWQLSLWICYTRKSSSEFAVVHREGTFSWKEDLKDTMKGEGMILAIVLAVLAVIFEAAMIIVNRPDNLIATALSPIFAISTVTGLKDFLVLRTVIAYVIETALAIAQLVWQHYRDFKKWNNPSGRR